MLINEAIDVQALIKRPVARLKADRRYSLEQLKAIAAHFPTRVQWMRGHRASYIFAEEQGMLDALKPPANARAFWTKQRLAEAAAKYLSEKHWAKHHPRLNRAAADIDAPIDRERLGPVRTGSVAHLLRHLVERRILDATASFRKGDMDQMYEELVDLVCWADEVLNVDDFNATVRMLAAMVERHVSTSG